MIKAKGDLAAGDFYWNSGMFLFRAGLFLKELQQFRPDIAEACRASVDQGRKDLAFFRLDEKSFAACPAESIDYAVMEKSDKSAVVALEAGWSDIGSWSALWELDTKDAVLVADKSKAQEVKHIIEQLRAKERPEDQFHRVVYRTWGHFDSIEEGNRFKVKRITVKPGAKLSVQMHHHRAEHWIVVSGTAKVTKGEETFLLTENESIYMGIGEVHALENPGVIPLDIIEVQTGSYLGEDDIVRFEDIYGRSER